jgi:hypothetical protein
MMAPMIAAPLRAAASLLIVLSGALVAGCSAPKTIELPPQPARAEAPPFRVEYAGTPHATGRPMLFFVLEPEYATRHTRVEVIDSGNRRLESRRNVFRSDRFTVDLFRPGHPSDDHAIEQLTIHLHRRGVTDVYPLRVRLARHDVTAEPERVESPSLFLGITYPLWGFWRDLIDAPLTMLTRAGLTTARLGEPAPTAANALVFGGAFAGGAYFASKGFRNADNFFEAGLYGGAFGFFGAAVGGAAAVVVAGAYEWIVVPIQTALFRTGIDLDFVKREPYVVFAGGDPYADAAEHERLLRSRSYFPNWRFLVRGETAVPSQRTIPLWIVEDLAIAGETAPQGRRIH